MLPQLRFEQKRESPNVLIRPVLYLGVAVFFVLVGCSPPYDGGRSVGEVVPEGGVKVCEEGEATCQGNDIVVCKDNKWVVSEVACLDNNVVVCKDDKLLVTSECDEASGQVCSDGACYYPCEKAKEEGTSVGCEYYAAVLPNPKEADVPNPFGLIISNTSNINAIVTIEGNDAQYAEAAITTVIETITVPPNSVKLVPLKCRFPIQKDYTLNVGSYLATTPYHIVSNVPVVVHQLCPTNYMLGVSYYDGSLLLAVHSLGKKNLALSYPQIEWGGESFLSVIATKDDTQVTVVPTTKVKASNTQGPVPVPASDPFKELVFKLNKGEILNLQEMKNGSKDGIGTSFSGSTVDANKPVAVFSGTNQGNVPNNAQFGSHMEHQMFPEKTLGKEFVAAHTPPMSTGGVKELEYWLVLGTVDGTTVTTTLDPPQDKAVLNRGEVVEFKDTGDFTIQSDQPVMVGQFTSSKQSSPIYILVSPVEQFLDRYITMSPWASDPRTNTVMKIYLIITVPSSATFTLDGLPPSVQDCEISEVTAAWNVYRCLVDDSRHEVQASSPVGLVVYDVAPWEPANAFMSFGFNGGVNMQEINPVEIE